ncbi:MBL fold metallo-hydrolase [Patescibacteria group bacterium]|nr:MBL fold metallo-hydrolase [Patescibacteria group bacterium]MCG2694663.1 MBL fold metallo-hydrolase [Candidatus Parcubacteria bacterium]
MKNQTEKFKLTFWGGAGFVTGVNFMLEGVGKKILVDIGSFTKHEDNDKPLPYNPSEIDFLFVSHAQMEHMGRIPKLIKEGFKGTIYSTQETKFLSELMLTDCLGACGFSFEEEEVKQIMSLWKTISYGEIIDLNDGLTVKMYDAGHILGSSFFDFSYNNNSLIFANSVGSSFTKELSGIEENKKIKYLVIESVYGDKIHKLTDSVQEYVEDIIETTIKREGNVLIPVSSIDKIYLLLREIYSLMGSGKIPKIPVFVDSLLVEKSIGIYEKIFKCEEYGSCNSLGNFVNNFEGLKFVKNGDDLGKIEGPKIIIGGVGVSDKKKIDTYVEKYISDPNSSIIIPDYQIIGSLGRKLQEEEDFIVINEKKMPINIQIETIDGYSSHADHNHLFKFVDDLKDGLEKVFVVIGEEKSSEFLMNKLRDYLGVNSTAPKRGESFELEF